MNEQVFTIRRAKQADIQEITTLAGQYELRRLLPEDARKRGFLVSHFTEKDYARFLKYADYFYVVQKDGRIVGFLLAYSSEFIQPNEWLNMRIRAYHPEPFVLIKQIAVAPQYQGKGIASRLYKYLFEHAQERPFFTVIVIDPPNQRSIAFHERLGFHKVFEAVPPDGLRRGVWKREKVV